MSKCHIYFDTFWIFLIIPSMFDRRICEMCQILENTKKDGWYILSNRFGILWKCSICLWCYLIIRYSIWNIVKIFSICRCLHGIRIGYIIWAGYFMAEFYNLFLHKEWQSAFSEATTHRKPILISFISFDLVFICQHNFENTFQKCKAVFFGIWRTYNVTA